MKNQKVKQFMASFFLIMMLGTQLVVPMPVCASQTESDLLTGNIKGCYLSGYNGSVL